MRVIVGVLASVLWFVGCEQPEPRCVPLGAQDFYMVREGCGPLSGTFDITSETKATLTVEEGERACTLTLNQDNRADPINACQVSWSCAAPASCAGCPPWSLSLLYLPTGDGVMPGGNATLGSGSCSVGRWSAARRTP